ncbi:DUF3859 domain-containing protein [Puniceibacterium sp. IMCC21224]|uniref:DUF3859 domain-containing protein n=1 Tax=Puniceibacterium sp. IMCC21224 TaxID=1618204 RepID=UPI00065DAB5A|nr:DUF3859 domain-containing protein [Puniceibacterium sp. IMCC21224]KMK66070.1 protein of unknown function (DUF3859) [Puniceibacterium sp. IMCC21224]
MIRTAIPFALLCLAPLSLWAESGTARFDASRVSVTQGIFCEIVSAGTMPAPDTAAGLVELYDRTPEFQWLGTRVPAVPGLSFGVRTEVLGGAFLPGVVISLTHPALRGTDITSQQYTTVIGGNGPSINAYTFDLPKELVTGTWTFSATQNGREIYTASFEVVPPAQEPQIANSCGAAPMS